MTGLSSLPEPPVLHPEHLVAWWGGHTPVVAAVSLLRFGGLVCGGYWLLLCSAVIVLTRSGGLLRLAHVSIPGLGRLMKVATGGSLLGVAVICAAGCAATGSGPSSAGATPPELVPLENPAVAAKSLHVTAPRLQAVPATSGPSRSQAVTREPSLVPATTPAEETTATSWTVKPGEDLWSITEAVLIARLGHPPDQRDVASLWLRVIDANRPRLPDPANPNLIFAGDVIIVPG